MITARLYQSLLDVAGAGAGLCPRPSARVRWCVERLEVALRSLLLGLTGDLVRPGVTHFTTERAAGPYQGRIF